MSAVRLRGAVAIAVVAAGAAMLVLGAFAAGSFLGGSVSRSWNRQCQKRTIGDIRTLATAVEHYSIDHGAFPAARSMGELASLLEPTYVKSLPRVDGWGYELDYRTIPSEAGYVIRSRGADGAMDTWDATRYFHDE